MLRVLIATLASSMLAIAAAQAPTEPQDAPSDQERTEDRVVEAERGVATEVAPGITVIIDPVSTSPLVVAEEIYFSPHFVEVAIPFDRDYTTFSLELASRVSTRVQIEVSDPSNLISRADEVVVPAGARLSTGFAAFEPHAGVIRLSNEFGELLAEVPYNITKQSRFQHTVSGFASTGFSTDFIDSDLSPVAIGVGYSLLERVSGMNAGITFEYNTDGTLSGRGSVSGSYSW